MTKGVVQSIVEADKTLFTLKFPAQPQLGERFIEPSEAQMVVFTEGSAGYRGVKNAFNLLDTLYKRGVTTPHVLEVLLEATGHPVIAEGLVHSDDLETSTEESVDHER